MAQEKGELYVKETRPTWTVNVLTAPTNVSISYIRDVSIEQQCSYKDRLLNLQRVGSARMDGAAQQIDIRSTVREMSTRCEA